MREPVRMMVFGIPNSLVAIVAYTLCVAFNALRALCRAGPTTSKSKEEDHTTQYWLKSGELDTTTFTAQLFSQLENHRSATLQ